MFSVFVADGTDTEDSDIDFLVDAGHEGCTCGLFTICGMHYDLEKALRCKIDFII